MAVIHELIEQIQDANLRQRIEEEVRSWNKRRKFGLVFEEHTPENTLLYDVPVKRGALVAKRDIEIKDLYVVIRIDGENAICEHTVSHEQVTMSKGDIVVVAKLGDPIYPYLKPMETVQNAPDSELWHTLIEADNYHALQLLAYLYAGQVDCIYIDPPYNSGARDWKYNNDYVDSNDSYRHSKWLSMIEKRLLLAKKLLNPNDSVLIVTIDDKEYSRLGCLLEQLFPSAKITMISSVINPAGKSKKGGVDFSRIDEYIFYLQIGNAKIQPEIREVKQTPIAWETFRRHSLANGRGKHGIGACGPNQFYPIYIDNNTKKIVKFGEPLKEDVDRFTVESIDGCTAVFPVRDNGIEMNWAATKETAQSLYEQGYLKVGDYKPSKPQQYIIKYLTKGVIKDIKSGKVIIKGYDNDGYLKGYYEEGRAKVPTTAWNKETHNATSYGTDLINKIFIDERFSYPKSLYAVRDCLKFFIENKYNALILDFFAGSGTTLHAVNLLNAEDGGHRRCIMVTNNEIGETKEKELKPQGIRPGDEEWEKWGIARYVNWPRAKCSIKGVDVNGNPLEGEYITCNTEKKLSDRNIIQIDFLVEGANLAKKKKLVALINKQKDVKLPTLKEDTPYLLTEEDDTCNGTILFDITAFDDWMEALDGHDEITNIYVVTPKASEFNKIKEAVKELLGQIEETFPVNMPMSDGFKANAAYFKLSFLDKTAVALGRQFKELLPLLWMKAGARGKCPELDREELPQMLIYEQNHFAVLIEETAYHAFEEGIRNRSDVIDTIFFVTDSDRGFKEMSSEIGVANTYQLYRDYLDNFRINNIK